MRRRDQLAAFAAVFQEASAGRARQGLVETGRRRPVGPDALQHGVHEVAAQHGAQTARFQAQADMAGRVSRQGFEADSVVERMVAPDELVQSRLDDREDAVGERAVVVFARVLRRLAAPELVFVAREEVAGVGESGDPASVGEPRVPAHMVEVEVGAEDDIDVLRRAPGGAEASKPGVVAAHVPSRADPSPLVVADAGIDQDREARRAHEIALDDHVEPSRGGVDEARLEPGAMGRERLRRAVGVEAEGVELRSVEFDDPVDGDVAEGERGHGEPRNVVAAQARPCLPAGLRRRNQPGTAPVGRGGAKICAPPLTGRRGRPISRLRPWHSPAVSASKGQLSQNPMERGNPR